MSFGKLSSKGPIRPFVYQMKWPIPRDAKSSPLFQEVSPSREPPHSFCQTRWPILSSSLSVSASAPGQMTQSKASSATNRAEGRIIRPYSYPARAADQSSLLEPPHLPAAPEANAAGASEYGVSLSLSSGARILSRHAESRWNELRAAGKAEACSEKGGVPLRRRRT